MAIKQAQAVMILNQAATQIDNATDVLVKNGLADAIKDQLEQSSRLARKAAASVQQDMTSSHRLGKK